LQQEIDNCVSKFSGKHDREWYSHRDPESPWYKPANDEARVVRDDLQSCLDYNNGLGVVRYSSSRSVYYGTIDETGVEATFNSTNGVALKHVKVYTKIPADTSTYKPSYITMYKTWAVYYIAQELPLDQAEFGGLVIKKNKHQLINGTVGPLEPMDPKFNPLDFVNYNDTNFMAN